jgi:hypothetical protein
MFKLIYALLLGASLIQAQSTCPIEITKITVNGWRASLGDVLQAASSNTPVPDRTGRAYTLSYSNASGKTVLSIRFGVAAHLTNSMHETQKLPDDFITTEGSKLKPGKSFAQRLDRTGSEDQDLDKAWVQKVLFADGQYWNDDGKQSCVLWYFPKKKGP